MKRGGRGETQLPKGTFKDIYPPLCLEERGVDKTQTCSIGTHKKKTCLLYVCYVAVFPIHICVHCGLPQYHCGSA